MWKESKAWGENKKFLSYSNNYYCSVTLFLYVTLSLTLKNKGKENNVP